MNLGVGPARPGETAPAPWQLPQAHRPYGSGGASADDLELEADFDRVGDGVDSRKLSFEFKVQFSK
jgi:hypothetical protein